MNQRMTVTRRHDADLAPRSTWAARVVTSIAVLIVAGTALAACSVVGGSPAETGPTAETSGTPRAAAAALWGACMRDQGIDVDDPTPEMHAKGIVADPGDVDQDTWERALAACDDGTRSESAIAQQEAALQAAWRRYAACMAENGIEGVGEEPGTGPDPASDPASAAAREECGPLVQDFTVTP
ncbi:hypothetical protein [Frigoribacterium sp. R86507]|uniref:hypothetical protein n=1 Tax=Frigoribacterium sp. R86507 TaxID=3093850 RepID=UPI0037CA3D89